MTIAKSVERLFTIHGVLGSDAQRARAALYVEELVASGICVQCIEATLEEAIHNSKRLPDWPDLRDSARRQTDLPVHSLHLTAPALVDDDETWWRAEAVKVILPKASGDKMLASFIAAQMWGSGVQRDLDAVVGELEDFPIWISAARTFLEDRDKARAVEWRFRRSRWIYEHHPSEVMPEELEEVSA